MSTLLSALLAIVLVAGVVPIADQAVRHGAHVVRAHEVASQGYAITQATDQYVKANYSALLAATAAGPTTIPVSALTTTGYLPRTTNAIDAYGQTWQISFFQPAKNDLDVLINASGGRPINAVILPMLAAEMGSRGGFQPDSGGGPYSSDAGDAIGSFGGWKLPVSDFGLTAAPGTPADLLYYNSGTLSSTYLYRVAVPGNPQVNTMQTNLNAGGNNVTNTGTVQFTTNGTSGTIVQGASCSSTGAIGTNSNGSGELMVCQGGTWEPVAQAASSLVWDAQYSGPSGITWANICAEAGSSLGGFGGNYSGNNVHIYPIAGPNAQGQYYWEINGYFDGYSPYVECWDIQ